MRVSLQTDNTLHLPTDAIVTRLNSLCRSITFAEGTSPIRISDAAISCPKSFKQVLSQLPSGNNFDFSIVFTAVPYENNFFYEEHKGLVLVSSSNWHLLTDQPLVNGVFYFICSLISETLSFGTDHYTNRGCINDVLIDKTGIDTGMRAASLCPECKADIKARGIDATDLLSLLDVVAHAARNGASVLDAVIPQGNGVQLIDLFLCHNSAEKDEVRVFNTAIKAKGIVTWLDEDDLPPGSDWQQVIQEAIPRVRAAAVCVGANGLGPWQRMEIKGLLSEFVERACRVVPVILPTAQLVPELPLFLRQFTWLDLRDNQDRGIERLVNVIRNGA